MPAGPESRVPTMQRLTDQGWQKILELAQRYGVSTDAVMSMLQSVVNGNGTMAQFYHSELGGGGQWMMGGMTMVGDMFNYSLKSKVDGLCTELSQLLSQQPFVPPASSNQSQWQGDNSFNLFVSGHSGGSGSWWPAELGSPNGSGGQNNARYAYFTNARRLAVDLGGNVTVYDTLDHQIGGVSQQQGIGGSLTLCSQYGTVDVASLPVVSVNGVAPQQPFIPPPFQPTPPPQPWNPPAPEAAQESDIFSKIERLAELHKKGILSPEEVASKKSELLARL